MRNIEKKLLDAILEGVSFETIHDRLIDLKQSGVSSEEVLRLLKDLRSIAPDEACEDRILDTMDIVTGWCPPDHRVWDS